MTAADLQAYVGAGAGELPYLGKCWAEAEALVERYIGAAEVPDEIVHRACLEVGSELFQRKNAPGGITRFASTDGMPIRLARDPMLGAYPILNRYLGGGFA